LELLPTKAVRHLAAPTVLAGVFTFLVSDPTYRFPLIAFVLPMFLRGAAKALEVGKDTTDDSRVGRFFVMVGFAGFVVGWLLVFAILAFTAAVGLFSVSGSADILKVAMTLAALGFVVAAWFWWPWYVRDELASWPRHDVRVWTSSSNRWDRLYLSWRMQQFAESADLRAHGFMATAGVVLCVFALAAVGAYTGLLARGAEVVLVLALPVAHAFVVQKANALCERWTAGRAAIPGAADRDKRRTPGQG